MATQELAAILQATLSPDATVRRQAERELTTRQAAQGFGNLVLSAASDPQIARPLRQAAALNFKNWIRANYAAEEAPTPLTQADADALKAQVVPVMIALAQEQQIQVQIGEAISLMAEADFPDAWPNLIEQLVSHLSADDYTVNNAVLQTAHSIFRRWRAQFSSNELFLEINFVIERFCEPYLALFKRTDELLKAPSTSQQQTPVLLRATLLLLQLYYDFNSQDLPDFFEDRLSEFMPMIFSYINYSPPGASASKDDDEEEDATDLEKVQAEVCDIANLYSVRYLDAFGDGGYLQPFVEHTWQLLTRVGRGVKYDLLVAHATGFLGTVVKIPSQRALFDNQQTLESFCERIILPNMTLRTFEEEMFEDDPVEYVRRDLDVSVGTETRRQAATDFVRALMEQFESQVTSIISRYIGAALSEYAQNPQANWRAKDTAIFLLASIATRGSTQQQGVTSTNQLVDVAKFFSDHAYADLQAPAGNVHPIIVADAIKFLYTFRGQLTKEQLLSVFPVLIPHLANPSFVIHTYAALTIERILFIKQNNALVFGQADIKPYAESILDSIFKVVESGDSPQQVAANDNLMKSAMRVILTARQGLNYRPVLDHLVRILAEVSKNPSNPKFNHFLFESISGLIRFSTPADASALADIEAQLFPPFQHILQTDVAEFMPFVFQILSQLLELHTSAGLPDAYQALFQPLLTPALWSQRGNVPALVRLVRAYLSKGAQSIAESGQFSQLLGIFQYLIQAKANDQFGFELLEAFVEFMPPQALKQYLSTPVSVLLLTRLQNSKTDKFTTGFLRFLCLCAATTRQGYGPDATIDFIDGVQPQPGLFAQMMPVLLPVAHNAPLKDRKLIAVGLASFLAKSSKMLAQPYVGIWTPMMGELLRLLMLPLPLGKQEGDEDEALTTIADQEEYQASFSRLGASERPRADPVGHVSDPRTYLAESLVTASQAQPLRHMIAATAVPEPFLGFLAQGGYDVR